MNGKLLDIKKNRCVGTKKLASSGGRRQTRDYSKNQSSSDANPYPKETESAGKKFQVSLLVNNRGLGTLARISSMLATEDARVEFMDFKACTPKGMAHLHAFIALGPNASLDRLIAAARKMPEIKTASISEKA